MAKALIVVDVQNDFCEGGSLAVDGGADVATRISEYVADTMGEYDLIVATRDWHVNPGDHFASHTGGEPDYSNTWPDHCVAGTGGAEYHPNLIFPAEMDNFIEVFKGQEQAAYSGFEGWTNDVVPSDLNSMLKLARVDEVDVCGIATDYCVRATALDAKANGYETKVLANLTVGVATDTSVAAIEEMGRYGIDVTEVL